MESLRWRPNDGAGVEEIAEIVVKITLAEGHECFSQANLFAMGCCKGKYFLFFIHDG